MSHSLFDYKPIYHIEVMLTIHFLFSSELHLTKFLSYMNSKHWNINFTVKCEENNSLSFINIKIFRNNRKFHTSIDGKPTCSVVSINFESYPYRTNIILFTPCYIIVLWFVLPVELCILKFWNKNFFELKKGTLNILLIVASKCI